MSQMQKLIWVKSISTNEHASYQLWAGNTQIMSLELNPLSHTAKVACLQTRRIFKIEKEGFLRSKTILKNEYGVKIGLINQENWFTHEGSIELNNQRFVYKYHAENKDIASIFKEPLKDALLVCDMIDLKKDMENFDSNPSKHDKNATFLMALAWYVFLPNTQVDFLQIKNHTSKNNLVHA